MSPKPIATSILTSGSGCSSKGPSWAGTLAPPAQPSASAALRKRSLSSASLADAFCFTTASRKARPGRVDTYPKALTACARSCKSALGSPAIATRTSSIPVPNARQSAAEVGWVFARRRTSTAARSGRAAGASAASVASVTLIAALRQKATIAQRYHGLGYSRVQRWSCATAQPPEDVMPRRLTIVALVPLFILGFGAAASAKKRAAKPKEAPPAEAAPPPVESTAPPEEAEAAPAEAEAQPEAEAVAEEVPAMMSAGQSTAVGWRFPGALDFTCPTGFSECSPRPASRCRPTALVLRATAASATRKTRTGSGRFRSAWATRT